MASAAGVSTQTVSRVINERPDVSAETRETRARRDRQAGLSAKRPGAEPDPPAQLHLGVVTAGLRHIGPSRTLSGITAAAADAGYALLLEELPRFDTDDPTPIFEALLSRHVDGVIWAVPEVGDESKLGQPAADGAGDPDCVPDHGAAGRTSRWFRSTIILGARLAMAHLIEQGYRHIGHITGPLDWWEARQRMAAGRMRCMKPACRPSDGCWAEGNWSSASGAEAAEKLFEQYPEMDAVFVANDQMALSVLHSAPLPRAQACPRIWASWGSTTSRNRRISRPALTTVQQDQYNVGRVAVEEIIKIIEIGLARDWNRLNPNPSCCLPRWS